ncbi:MAG: glycerol-3-phosphate 1-O-acyltransferase PlsY [Lachnospiraceae bacterium]|nr:glycerol-3-phosphate 1-O-acyltransferase PlsY [Lachnospiraceae bacterium]
MTNVFAASLSAFSQYRDNLLISIPACVIIGYLIGCINLSYIIARFKGFDIREHGSGNAGASNVIITVGKKAGAFVALFDIFKAYFAVNLTGYLFPGVFILGAVTGVSVILGHIFPFFMGFKGGKGFASLGGSILALDYRIFIILLIATIFVVFISNYVCFGPTSVSLIFPLVYGYVYRESGGWYAALILYIAAVAIIYRHAENFKRIREGNELKFSFLWNRKAEADRFGVENDDGFTYPFELEEDGAIKHKK